MFKKSLAYVPQNATQQFYLATMSLNPPKKDTNVKKGVVEFIPLISVVSSGLGVEINDVNSALFPWFHYSCMFPGDEPGKIKYVNVSWIDTGLQAGKDGATLSDPGYSLDLHLKMDDRKPILGFGVPAGKYQDSKAYEANVRIPILVNFETNGYGNVKDGTGEVVLLELNAAKLKALVAVLQTVTKKFYYYQADGSETPTTFPYKGIAFAVRLAKDTTLAPRDAYKFVKTDTTISMGYAEEVSTKGKEVFETHVENAKKLGAFYQPHIDAWTEGKLTDEVAQNLVLSSIMAKLLTAWGIPFEDTPDGIIEKFQSVYSRFRYALTANSSAAIAEKPVKVDISALAQEPKEEGLPF